MWTNLQPREAVSSIYRIDAERLWSLGYRVILTDLDNTLTAWNSPSAGPQLIAWLDALHNRGFRVCILSNNARARVEPFAAKLGIPSLWKAGKPARGAFCRALDLLQAQARECVMVGDQVFTDVWGGNRMGMYTVLVRPVAPHEEAFQTRILRICERLAGVKTPQEADDDREATRP